VRKCGGVCQQWQGACQWPQEVRPDHRVTGAPCCITNGANSQRHKRRVALTRRDFDADEPSGCCCSSKRSISELRRTSMIIPRR
jgi:hypothetical protein